MLNKSIIIAVCSAIVIMLSGCANGSSDSGISDGNAADSSYAPAASGDASEPVSNPSEPVTSGGPSSGDAVSITSGGSNNNGASTADIGLEAAKAAALKHAGVAEADASFTEAKLEYDDGVAEYDIEFTANAKRYDYEIRASDGAVLEFSSKAIPDPTGLLSEAKAKELALAHTGFSEEQVTFTKCKLDYDDGISEYEIKFTVNGVEYEVELNAKTGEILKSEIDRD